jgi:hypothetical protein
MQRRVVHGGGRSALATNRPTAAVGNPCSAAEVVGGGCVDIAALGRAFDGLTRDTPQSWRYNPTMPK